jgi:hypothetical protein
MMLGAIFGGFIGAAVSIYDSVQRSEKAGVAYYAFCAENPKMAEYDNLVGRISRREESPQDAARFAELRKDPVVVEGIELNPLKLRKEPGFLDPSKNIAEYALITSGICFTMGIGADRAFRRRFPLYD